MTNNIKIELCCGSLEDCLTAEKCNVDRIELVQAHQLGGLTASYGTLVMAKESVNVPIMTIIRPRMSGFYYSEEDYKVMCIDAKEMLSLGADGIVFGFLKEDSSLDYERTARFIDIIGNKEIVFHRAFDIVTNKEETIESLIKLGVTRILTSGGHSNSYDGRHSIRKWQETYGDYIEILVGGGITENNISEIISFTGVTQVHFGGTNLFTDASCLNNASIPFGSTSMPANECFIAVDSKRVNSIINNI